MKRVSFFLVIAALLAMPNLADAGLFSKLGRLGGDAGGAGRKVDGIGGTDVPATALRAAKDPNGTAVALSIDDAGTIRLTDELGRATDIRSLDDLDGALQSIGKDVSVVADTATLGRNVDVSRRLAERGILKLWIDKAALPVRVSDGNIAAEVRPNVLVPVLKSSDIARAGGRPIAHIRTSGVREVHYAFNKPLTRGTVIVAKIGKAANGPRKVGFGDVVGRPGETVTLTKDELVQGMSTNRGGTVILTGRIEGDTIKTGQGAVPLADVQSAAAAADVHLVLLNGSAKAAHTVVEKSDTYGDLILGLTDRRTPMIADAFSDGRKRVRLSFRPEAKAQGPANTSSDIDDTALLAGSLARHVGSTAVDFFTPDKAEEEDRDLRIIPWLSFGQHLFFGGSILFALLGHRPAWWFWRKIWVLPTSSRSWRIARGAGYALFMLFTGLFWGTIRYMFGWLAWFIPSWRRPKAA
ncbi:MAG: hypothetical protein AAF557_13650 [Pseudomonadota bacterium]